MPGNGPGTSASSYLINGARALRVSVLRASCVHDRYRDPIIAALSLLLAAAGMTRHDIDM